MIQLIKMIIGIKSDYHLFAYNRTYAYLCNVQNTSKITTRDSNGTEIALEPITREQLDNMMKQSNVHLTNNDNPYDAVFVANMCKADYLGSSVPDGLHLCLYVKDVIDDVDGYDGIAFNRWYADMCRKGIQIDWYNCR